ncbi:MAG: hypothetical protein ACREXR_14410, partial [Gammaproteobacteria bacterium]
MKLKARIDTGAGVSSIDAKIVEIKPVADGSGERVIFQIKDDEGKIKSTTDSLAIDPSMSTLGANHAGVRPHGSQIRSFGRRASEYPHPETQTAQNYEGQHTWPQRHRMTGHQ